MTRPPLFGIGFQGVSPAVTAKKLQNMYVEFRPQGEKSQVVALPTPGFDLFSAPSVNASRGKPIFFDASEKIYVVQDATLWEVNNAGVATNRGTLSTSSGFVSMAHNGLSILIVDGTFGYFYDVAGNVFTQIVAAAFPSNPKTASFLDGYFIVNKGLTGQFNLSDLYDVGPVWDGSALDFAVAESSPDNLLAVFVDHSQAILFGVKTIEFWSDSGANSFPFARIQGAVVEWGLAAVASLEKFDNSVAFLAKPEKGNVIVARLNGYQIQRISNSDLETVINGFANIADATAYSYLLAGHPMYQLNFPSAGYSFLYDASTNIWSQLKSFGVNRHIGEYAVDFLGRTIVTDYSNGNLYVLNPTTYTDNTATIEREIIGEHWDSQGLERQSIHCVRLDVETGVGLVSGQGSDPQVMMQCSKDRGRTWGMERWRSLGAMGNYKKLVEWNRWGMSRSWTFKVRVTDPVKFVVLGAIVNPQD